MTMLRFAPVLLVLPALLAACEDGRDAATVNNTAERHISIRNEGHERLLALDPLNQRLAMMRAIRQTGHRCVRVDNAGYQEEYRNLRMWVAQCGVEQKTWAVFLAANDDVQVRDCAEAGQLGLPRCEALPPAAPTPEFDAANMSAGNVSRGNRTAPAAPPRPPLANSLR